MSPPHAAAIQAATERLVRVTLLFGLAGSLVGLATALQQATSLTVPALGVAWSLSWAVLCVRPQLIVPVLRDWPWTMVLVAGLSAATILATGGFSSPLKAEANWLTWTAAVLLGTRASLGVAAILSTGLLTVFLLSGMSPEEIITGADRLTAITDILNPLIIALIASAVTGVFRLVLLSAEQTLWHARRGETASSPGMLALLAGQPALALPAGDTGTAIKSHRPRLSPAERDILGRLADGQTPQQIALARRVRSETVYEQIASAKQKAGATTIEHLIALAWRPPT